jgi:SAM-dependent methyltransferase
MVWYEDFFTGLHAELWREAVPEAMTAAECDFLARALGLGPGAAVLDVPCAHGRHAVDLAGRGHRVTAVDISADLLAMGQEMAAAAGVTVDWRRGDMTRLDAVLDGAADFDAALCLGNSLPVLDRDGLAAYLADIAGALRPGGRLAIDIGLAAESLYPGFEERPWLPVGEGSFLLAIENAFDAAEGRIDATYTVIAADGRRDSRTCTLWVYTVAEIRAALTRAGLEAVQVTADIEGTPFTLGAEACWIIAERR